jgi:hypothetical protein
MVVWLLDGGRHDGEGKGGEEVRQLEWGRDAKGAKGCGEWGRAKKIRLHNYTAIVSLGYSPKDYRLDVNWIALGSRAPEGYQQGNLCHNLRPLGQTR